MEIHLLDRNDKVNFFINLAFDRNLLDLLFHYRIVLWFECEVSAEGAGIEGLVPNAAMFRSEGLEK